MARASRKGITPTLQWFAICQTVESEPGGGVTIRRIFDGLQVGSFPGTVSVTVTAQFTNGQGEHKYWLRMTADDGKKVEVPETSFWLANRRSGHRLDSNLQIGIGGPGRFTFTAILDGRDLLSIPLVIGGPEAILTPSGTE